MVSPSICILAGVMVDIVSNISLRTFLDGAGEKDLYIRSKFDWRAGGVGANLAICSVQTGFCPVYVISKVGYEEGDLSPDLPSQFIQKELTKLGINVIYCGGTDKSTGTAIVTYFETGKRIIIVDAEMEDTFNIDDLSLEMKDVVKNCDVLFVSGYQLLSKGSALATVELMKVAKDNNRLVVLDIVPHEIYKIISLEEFQHYSSFADVLISELNTIKHLYQEINELGANDLEKVSSVILRNHTAAILRPSNEDHFLFGKKGLIEHRHTNFESLNPKDKRGFSDKISIEMLYKILYS